jgi:hypothetical protein
VTGFETNIVDVAAGCQNDPRISLLKQTFQVPQLHPDCLPFPLVFLRAGLKLPDKLAVLLPLTLHLVMPDGQSLEFIQQRHDLILKLIIELYSLIITVGSIDAALSVIFESAKIAFERGAALAPFCSLLSSFSRTGFSLPTSSVHRVFREIQLMLQ